MNHKPAKIPRSMALEILKRIRIPELVSKHFLAGHRIQDIIRRESESMWPEEYQSIQLSIQSLLDGVKDYLQGPSQEKAKIVLSMKGINASRFAPEAALKRIKRGKGTEEDLLYLSRLLANLVQTLES